MRKLINHLIFSGKKRLSENILLNTSKELQKSSNKNFKKLIKLCLIYSTPIFRVNLLTNKRKKNTKQTFTVIKNKQIRTSLGIKYIIKTIKNGKSNYFYKKLYKEILLLLKDESSIIQVKNDLQEQVFFKKHTFLYYRWR